MGEVPAGKQAVDHRGLADVGPAGEGDLGPSSLRKLVRASRTQQEGCRQDPHPYSFTDDPALTSGFRVGQIARWCDPVNCLPLPILANGLDPFSFHMLEGASPEVARWKMQ